jgi:capsular polysaccharide biosynthesis protein
VRDLHRERGFEILEPGNMTIEAQAAALSEAAVVVDAHGSTFGNLAGF